MKADFEDGNPEQAEDDGERSHSSVISSLRKLPGYLSKDELE